ncbi:hypothetical protein SRABI98_00638 [Microbacterium sp. Bi98]|nr:hypothetical protein SRABI98_00638 [Microbacterium sp. Bi98]
MRLTERRRARIIEVIGDPLRCLNVIAETNATSQYSPDLRVVGVDGSSAQSKAAFAAVLRSHKRNASRIPASVSHVIAVVEPPAQNEPWAFANVHRWAMSIHRRIQRARGIDADVTVLLVDRDTYPDLILERIEELAQRPPGVNPAAVHTMREIRSCSIAQASTNDFI